MEIFRAVRQKLRLRWPLAAASFLVVSVGSFAGIRIADNLLLQTGRMSDKQALDNGNQISRTAFAKDNVPFSPVATSKLSQGAKQADVKPNGTDGLTNTNKNEEKKALFQKLAIDDARLGELQAERKRLPDVPRSTRQGLAVGSTTVDDPHEQLSSALVHLLYLEKRESADNPEIIAVREQITRLQARIAHAAADAPTVSRARLANGPSNEIKLNQIDAAISLCETQIIADLQRLSQGPSPTQEAKPQKQVAKASMESGQTAPVRKQISHLSTGLNIVVSIVLGVVFSICAVMFADRLDKSIRDEAMLRNLLPAAAEYIGSIPRMKSR